ncbi:hypothetical protein XENTR_v10020688 [Xenopus tropicalis]|nr:hypothetical protein XENTR_v10020688 [Xenopus tropicalis]
MQPISGWLTLWNTPQAIIASIAGAPAIPPPFSWIKCERMMGSSTTFKWSYAMCTVGVKSVMLKASTRTMGSIRILWRELRQCLPAKPL